MSLVQMCVRTSLGRENRNCIPRQHVGIGSAWRGSGPMVLGRRGSTSSVAFSPSRAFGSTLDTKLGSGPACTVKNRIASRKDSREDVQAKNEPKEDIYDYGNLIGSVGMMLFWVGFLAYAILWAPNQTPFQDQYFLKKFLGLDPDEYSVNAVFTQLFYIMGLWPLMYTALLIPAAKTEKGLPVWPFCVLSYGIGTERFPMVFEFLSFFLVCLLYRNGTRLVSAWCR